MSGEIERLSDEVGSQAPDDAWTAVSPVDIQETVRAAKEYAKAARAPNTVRAYNSDIEDFSTYCRVELGGASALPASANCAAWRHRSVKCPHLFMIPSLYR